MPKTKPLREPFVVPLKDVFAWRDCWIQLAAFVKAGTLHVQGGSPRAALFEEEANQSFTSSPCREIAGTFLDGVSVRRGRLAEGQLAMTRPFGGRRGSPSSLRKLLMPGQNEPKVDNRFWHP